MWLGRRIQKDNPSNQKNIQKVRNARKTELKKKGLTRKEREKIQEKRLEPLGNETLGQG